MNTSAEQRCFYFLYKNALFNYKKLYKTAIPYKSVYNI